LTFNSQLPAITKIRQSLHQQADWQARLGIDAIASSKNVVDALQTTFALALGKLQHTHTPGAPVKRSC
jgi:hypothetical protein